MDEINVLSGKPLPLGATITNEGVNFSIFSRNGTSVTLDIFENENDADPCFSYKLNSETNKTGDIWHVFLQGLKAGTLYLYRVDGPFNPDYGHRFNKNLYLLDPYAKCLTDCSIFSYVGPGFRPAVDKNDILMGKPQSALHFPKCVVIDDDAFDWQGDKPLNYKMNQCVLYETHLKGFTASSSSEVKHPGTYLGMVEKIPYLRELGITSVEFLPIHEFDENENTNVNPQNGKRLKNYWGYSTIDFFAPKVSYASNRKPGAAVNEFKTMVREFHKNGIEVILDVVFNHTAEGNENGLTLSFKGLDNSIYYILEDNQKKYYKNYSGCGNTFNCNHPVVRTFILDCLRYWVVDMHVDGFRFDLGSILGRDRTGKLIENPPMLERIAEDPILSHTKIIAEAWDAGGAYQVGYFPGGRWAEWNDRFRDDIRRFWRGDEFMANAAATRLSGSSDLYLRDGRKPFHSVNFITSHDGFTMNDLVSYNGKHNEENGENNRDGSDNNCSYNYGFEGHSSNRALEKTRVQQIKNIMLTLLLSQGTPMLLAGDEFRRSQNGNNNAYCQDSEINWIDWTLKEKNAELFRFVRLLIELRLHHPVFHRPEFFQGKNTNYGSLPDVCWFNENGKLMDWTKADRFISFRLDGLHSEIFTDKDDNDFFVMMNPSTQDKSIRVPKSVNSKRWYRIIDTSVPSPDDFLVDGNEELINEKNVYVLPARSCAVLLSK